jgi:peptidyl-prolyl cis-trans isomerase B (cyclophilin B)
MRVFFSILSISICSIIICSCGPEGSDQVVTIKTPQGEIIAILYDETPKHKQNFIKLANEHFFDSTLFHRVIQGVIIQGGDPESKSAMAGQPLGKGGPGYTIEAEINPKFSHERGALAAARLADSQNPKKASSGSQFYIVEASALPDLDGEYTIFGKVIKGIDVVDKIAVVQTGPYDRPMEDIRMTITVEEMPKKKIEKLYEYEYGQ